MDAIETLKKEFLQPVLKAGGLRSAAELCREYIESYAAWLTS